MVNVYRVANQISMFSYNRRVVLIEKCYLDHSVEILFVIPLQMERDLFCYEELVRVILLFSG